MNDATWFVSLLKENPARTKVPVQFCEVVLLSRAGKHAQAIAACQSLAQTEPRALAVLLSLHSLESDTMDSAMNASLSIAISQHSLVLEFANLLLRAHLRLGTPGTLLHNSLGTVSINPR